MDTYYRPKDLARFGDVGKDAPELWQKFSEWYGAVFKEGALTEREKALIALDDRSRARRGHHSRRRVARARRAGRNQMERLSM